MQFKRYHIEMIIEFSRSRNVVPDLFKADLSEANLFKADLSEADLSKADLSEANLSGADLSGADLREADLRHANLSEANLSGADLSGANLRHANLRHADLRHADLRHADLRHADLSGASGLLSSSEWFAENFETTKDGYIVYKAVHAHYPAPDHWKFEANEYLSEVANSNRTEDCGCGVNFATLDWIKSNLDKRNQVIWRCLIEWRDLPSVIVPYNTDGKARCERLKLLEIVDTNPTSIPS